MVVSTSAKEFTTLKDRNKEIGRDLSWWGRRFRLPAD
jgi:hypothetical protein